MAIGRINATLTGVQPGGLAKIVPTSVAVGSGSGSVDSNGNITFSGASSVSLNGCFTSSYQNYKIVFHLSSASSGSDITVQLRTSGTNASGSDYQNTTVAINTSGAASNYGSGTTNTLFYVAQFSTSNITGAEINLYSPFESVKTRLTTLATGGTPFTVVGGCLHNVATSYDGITFAGGTNLAGTIRVYGYTQ